MTDHMDTRNTSRHALPQDADPRPLPGKTPKQVSYLPASRDAQPRVAVTELVPGAIVRMPKSHYAHPYCLEVEYAQRVSKLTGAVNITGKVLPLSGLPGTRKKPIRRSELILPGQGELVRRGKAPKFIAKVDIVTICWVIVRESDGKPLTNGKGGIWRTREYAEMTEEEQRLRRDPIDQMCDRVRQERGILRVERMVYDLSTWHHDSAMELVDGQWKCTSVCKRCGRKLEFMKASPWWQTLDSDTTCHGEVWVP